MKSWAKLIISLATAFAAAGIGSLATFANIPTWYATLEKPFFNPPNWVFGPVWTVLYILIGVSFYKLWTAEGEGKRTAYVLYGAQLTLNALWSIVFFGLHWLWLAVAVIVLLWISIVGCMVVFARYSRVSAYLLIPYLLWVTFATALNIAVALLNS